LKYPIRKFNTGREDAGGWKLTFHGILSYRFEAGGRGQEAGGNKREKEGGSFLSQSSAFLLTKNLFIP
jgi:hypothetical protein